MNKKGFTLVELIVVIAILGIISSAIMMVFQFTTNSFSISNKQAQVQFEVRRAVNELKKYLSVANNVSIYSQKQTPVSGNSYCYLQDNIIHLFIDGKGETLYLRGLTSQVSTSLTFTPFTSASIKTEHNKDMIKVAILVNDYEYETDIYIMNVDVLTSETEKSITDKRINGNPGVYIEFDYAK